jgi:hypothetical protein
MEKGDTMTDLAYYITNCISRILSSPCNNKNLYRRAEDITKGVEIAASLGLDNAHTYFAALCKSAEGGKYGQPKGEKVTSK